MSVARPGIQVLTTVRDDKASEVPTLSQQLSEQLTVGTGRHTIDGIVAAHVGACTCVPTCLECWLERLYPVPVVNLCIKAESTDWNVLRSTMDIKVLACCLERDRAAHNSSS